MKPFSSAGGRGRICFKIALIPFSILTASITLTALTKNSGTPVLSEQEALAAGAPAYDPSATSAVSALSVEEYAREAGAQAPDAAASSEASSALSSSTSSAVSPTAPPEETNRTASSGGTNPVRQTGLEPVELPAVLLPDPVSAAELPAALRVDVPYISQKGLLPTGCEIASALMVLRHYGFAWDVQDFISGCLDQGSLRWANGALTGPHPSDAFVGNPNLSSGFGCFAPVIARALYRAEGDSLWVADTTGMTLDELSARFLSRGIPVLVWASINMAALADGAQWVDERTGEAFTWPANEHCLVLTGCDGGYYYFNDPYNSNGANRFAKSLVQSRFDRLGRQSVAAYPK